MEKIVLVSSGCIQTQGGLAAFAFTKLVIAAMAIRESRKPVEEDSATAD